MRRVRRRVIFGGEGAVAAGRVAGGVAGQRALDGEGERGRDSHKAAADEPRSAWEV